MTARPNTWVIHAFLPFIFALAAGAEMQDSGPGIAIHVYNYASVPQHVLDQAKREAGRIYRRAGLQTEWLDCPLSPGEASRYPECRLPPGALRFVLRVISREMAGRIGLPETSFGRSWFPEEGGFGVLAAVCAHRTRELAGGNRHLQAVLLGHLMAHEIGHLLLGTGSHSATGLMCAAWYPKQVKRIEQRTLLFNSKQARRIREQVARRTREGRFQQLRVQLPQPRIRPSEYKLRIKADFDLTCLYSITYGTPAFASSSP